jgi:hypothetical protein
MDLDNLFRLGWETAFTAWLGSGRNGKLKNGTIKLAASFSQSIWMKRMVLFY